ncbi:MAG: hypothetical protein ACK5Q5_18370 [Planctomycetaceae bacterium]
MSPLSELPRGSVFKLGGSLLDLPDWPNRVGALLATTSQPVLFAGGGAAADVVRSWDECFHLGAAAAHQLAMQSLSLTAALVQRLVPNSRLCATVSDVTRAWDDRSLPVIEPHLWFAAPCEWFRGTDPRLPETWDVTSDSLAAAVAIDLRGAELVLLKSIDWPAGCSLPSAPERDLVDAWLPRLATQLHCVRWVNLRAKADRGDVLWSRSPIPAGRQPIPVGP